jgi:hypothetical protein
VKQKPSAQKSRNTFFGKQGKHLGFKGAGKVAVIRILINQMAHKDI